MISENAMTLAWRLRRSVGKENVGIGCDARDLIELWSDNDPQQLRRAINELQAYGFVRVNEGIPSGPTGLPPEYGLHGVVSVTVMEAMQAFLDQYDART